VNPGVAVVIAVVVVLFIMDRRWARKERQAKKARDEAYEEWAQIARKRRGRR
jgi:hypothetical protein